MHDFSTKIIEWYYINQRNLPWRNTKDPYKIWLSEIILQQTRVDQGLDYYLRFVRTFPTVKQLAKADEDNVLKLWQGLGYYSRARNLHATAKIIIADHKGVFPDDYHEIIKLKGIGAYTAAAIASFAFDQAYPVVDGNVYRVLSRIFGIQTPIDSNEGKKEFYQLAEELLDKKNPAQHNQAIMEFGALHCKAQQPLCGSCCFQEQCLAFKNNMIGQLPVKAKSVRQRDRFFNYVILNHKDVVVLTKRTQKDIWKNLYEFPLIETDRQLTEEEFLASLEWKKLIGKHRYTIKSISRAYKHILSHQKIHARFWEVELERSISLKDKTAVYIERDEIGRYAVSRLIENYCRSMF